MSAAPSPPARVVLDRRTRVLRRGGVVRVLGGDPVTLVTPTPSVAGLLRGQVLTCDTPAAAALARALTDRGMAHPDATRPDPAHPARALGEVAVVIPVRDDLAGLAALVHALAPDLAGGARLVVVDDGSAVPLAVPPSPAGERTVILRHETSRGPAAARNAGTAAAVAAGARVVVYLDADVIPLPGWLGPLLAHLDDQLVAAVAPRIVAAEPGRFWVRGYETARSALDMGPGPARVRPRTRVAYVPSAALAVSPHRLPPVPDGAGQGPFDERMHVAEDVDLCWRTDRAGGRIRYEPASRVAHRHRTAVVPLLTRRAFYGTGAAPLADRQGAAVAPDGPQLVSPLPPPADLLEGWGRQEALHAGLQRLQERCRSLLTLVFLAASEPSYDDIAAQLGIPKGSIGPTRNRCLQQLRAILEGLGFGHAQ